MTIQPFDFYNHDIEMNDKTLLNPTMKDISEVINSLGTLTGGTDDIDIEDGNVVTGTISTASQTFTFSNPPASGTNGSFVFFITNGGSQTITWPTSVDWVDGISPTLTTGLDVIVFTTNDVGIHWLGFVVGLDVK